MRSSERRWPLMALAVGFGALGCADADNPTALSELEPETEFEVAAVRVETLEETEIHVEVTEGGAPLALREGELEIEHVASGATQTVVLEPEGHGYAAHVTFYRPGEHHLHVMGMPHRHRLMREMGELEIEVHRRHQVIGSYWVELALEPAPVLEGTATHIHLYVFDLPETGTPVDPATGLEVGLEIHDPGGGDAMLEATEEDPGVYEAEFTFGAAGVYEMHVEIGGAIGEFHIPVLSPDAEDDDGGHDDGGDGHDHGH